MAHPHQPGEVGKTLFLIIAAIIAASLLFIMIFRPGHSFA